MCIIYKYVWIWIEINKETGALGQVNAMTSAQAIEREAGERFHHETGFLAVGDPSMDYIHQVEQTMASFGTEGLVTSAGWCQMGDFIPNLWQRESNDGASNVSFILPIFRPQIITKRGWSGLPLGPRSPGCVEGPWKCEVKIFKNQGWDGELYRKCCSTGEYMEQTHWCLEIELLQSRRLLLLAHGSTHALLTCVRFQKLGYPSSPLLSPWNMTHFWWFWGPILGKIHLVMGTWNRTGLLYLHQKGGLRTALPFLKASHGLCGWCGLLVDLSWSEAPGCPLTNTAGGVSGSHGKLGIWVLALWPWSKQLWLGGERLKPKLSFFIGQWWTNWWNGVPDWPSHWGVGDFLLPPAWIVRLHWLQQRAVANMDPSSPFHGMVDIW